MIHLTTLNAGEDEEQLELSHIVGPLLLWISVIYWGHMYNLKNTAYTKPSLTFCFSETPTGESSYIFNESRIVLNSTYSKPSLSSHLQKFLTHFYFFISRNNTTSLLVGLYKKW